MSLCVCRYTHICIWENCATCELKSGVNNFGKIRRPIVCFKKVRSGYYQSTGKGNRLSPPPVGFFYSLMGFAIYILVLINNIAVATSTASDRKRKGENISTTNTTTY